jgi:WhiB family transcriptional regulator, redox-sensing transcriptional regulator
MTSDDRSRFVGIAWRLDRLRWVPRDVLAEIVTKDGLCVQPFTGNGWFTASKQGSPIRTDTVDREFAARLCAQCPVQDECLELELRMAGEETTGVWGALNERDRRALYPHWRQRGERAEPLDTDDDTEGGEWP